MIRHCVFVRFRPEISAAHKQAIYADLAGLKPRIQGFLAFSASANVSPEGLGQGFDDGFVIDFADAAARDAYLVDDEHKAIGSTIVAAAVDGVRGILVFDLDI